MTKARSSITAKKKPVVPAKTKAALQLNLALQGGGSHGAFTWGVLDRLLEEEDVEIVGISGTSAGAMNAAVLVDGYHEGGRARAKQQLHEFWYGISEEMSKISPFGPVQTPDYISQIPGLEWVASLNPVDMLSRVFSPYEMNPFNYNPLRTILERLLKNQHIQNGIPLFITATNVETGEAKVFREHEITIDVLLASACLPFVYQSVEIEGTPYWDGGYVGNPALWPLIYGTRCPDVLLVQINPMIRAGAPKTALDIINRVNEISFNSSLISEIRAINFVQKLIQDGKLSREEYVDVNLHRVTPPPDLHGMTASSKMNADWEFLQMLHSAGRAQMETWLAENKKFIGKKCSIDIKEHFLKKHGKPNLEHKKVST